MNSKRASQGFSTLEMLLAMTVFSLMLGALVLVLFGNTTFVADAASSREALSVAKMVSATEYTLAHSDFTLLAASTSIYAVSSTTYKASVSISLEPNYLTRKITTVVTWTEGYGRTGTVSLNSYVSDFKRASQATTCNLLGDWTHPSIQNVQTNFAQLINDATSTYTLTGVDAYKGKLYVTALASGATKKNFFIFDIGNPLQPRLLGSFDTTGPNIGSGGAAMVVATSSAGNFAYIANSYNANFATCTPKPADVSGGSCAQLQILDITNPANPTLVANYELPTTTQSAHVTSNGASGATGSNIFYKDGYVYLGLTKTATGPEFNVIDVQNPYAPRWVGGYKVGYVVNALYVHGNAAYLAHPTDSAASMPEQVTLLSLADKTNPVRVGGYKALDKQGNGKSLFGSGNTLYLGRTVNTTATNNDIYALQLTGSTNTLQNNLQTPQPLGAKLRSSVNALVTQGPFTAVLSGTSGTPGFFELFSFSSSTQPLAAIALPGASTGVALDCEGNYMYAASNDLSDKGYLSVISSL